MQIARTRTSLNTKNFSVFFFSSFFVDLGGFARFLTKINTVSGLNQVHVDLKNYSLRETSVSFMLWSCYGVKKKITSNNLRLSHIYHPGMAKNDKKRVSTRNNLQIVFGYTGQRPINVYTINVSVIRQVFDIGK